MIPHLAWVAVPLVAGVGYQLGCWHTRYRLLARVKKQEKELIEATENQVTGGELRPLNPLPRQKKCPGCGNRSIVWFYIIAQQCSEDSVQIEVGRGNERRSITVACPPGLHLHRTCKQCESLWTEYIPEDKRSRR